MAIRILVSPINFIIGKVKTKKEIAILTSIILKSSFFIIKVYNKIGKIIIPEITIKKDSIAEFGAIIIEQIMVTTDATIIL